MEIIGIIFVVVVLIYLMTYKIWIGMESHDKRFDKIVKLSVKHHRSTTGQEFNIKPIKYKDELFKNRYNNYEQKDDDKIIMPRHVIRESPQSTYRVVIENDKGDSFINAELLKTI